MRWRDYATHPELRDFVAVENGRVRALLRRGYEDHLPQLLSAAPGAAAEWVGGGRAAHPLVQLPDGERVLVRAYRRGGFVRHLNRTRYFGGHRAFAELLATERARRAGTQVPVVLAAIEVRRRVGYTARLATRWIDGAVDAARAIAAPGADRRAVLCAAGAQIAAMHAAGVSHPDLNLRNLLVRESAGDVVLLDFDRARLHAAAAPPAARRRDLRRLARSARKLGVALDAEDVAALRDGYGAAWPPDADLG